MNILFVLPECVDSIYEFERNKNILASLKKKWNHIGILSNSVCKKKLNSQKFTYFENIDDVNFKEWDVFVAQEFTDLVELNKKEKVKPILFISKNNELKNRYLNLPNLYHIISLYTKSGGSGNEISNEFITNLKPPIGLYRSSGNRNISANKMVYFASASDTELSTSETIIKLINQQPEIKLTVVASAYQIIFLKEIANSNTKFTTPKKSLTGYMKEHAIIIGSEEIAMAAAINHKTTLVIGKNGLGGLVDETNEEGFIRTGFNGRIGAPPNEAIPIPLFEYEIKLATGKAEASQKIENLKLRSLASKNNKIVQPTAIEGALKREYQF